MSGYPNPGRRPGRTRLRTRIAGVVAAEAVVACSGPAAQAFWQTLGANAGAVKADSLAAVAAPTASLTAGNAAVSWSAAATLGGRPVTGYTVNRYPASTGGTKVAATGGCAGTVTTLSCTEANLPGGTWYYVVTPVLASWQGAESGRSAGLAGDSTPPNAPAVSPALATLNAATATSASVTGTAEAGSSVTVTATDSSLPQKSLPPQTVTAGPDGKWSTVFNLAGVADGTITYTAIATDAAGNASAPGTATSNKDTVAPTAQVTLKNGPDANKNKNGFAETGDQVVIAYSETIKASTICGNWTDDSKDYTISSNQTLIQISTANVLTVTATGCNLGAVTLAGTYTSPSGGLTFGGGGGQNASTIAWDFTKRTLTLTLGKDSGSAATSAAAAGMPTASQPGITDKAGNPVVSAPAQAPSRF